MTNSLSFKPIAIPSQKSPEIEAHLKRVTGIDRIAHITSLVCPFCKKHVEGFRDEGSQREHTVSGLCQACQDETFGK